ncbi:MAG: polyphosphate polymerase domain-containing protein [Eggerthellaceae bacterium]|nr:polyphosphate polymerase domain-containing protein [Eggerthellaceae bacterium]
MKPAENPFERNEKKYILTAQQYRDLVIALQDRLEDDEYPESTVQSLYYDTPDRLMINRSLSKPAYKEKFRVRAYGPANEKCIVYVELKKKFKGVVYKRRVPLGLEEASLYVAGMPYEQAARLSIVRGLVLPEAFSWATLQTIAEFDACLARCEVLEPAMVIVVDRLAKRTVDGSDVRITFDHELRWRDTDLRLGCNLDGAPLFDEGTVVMEIKCQDAYPLWLARVLSTLHIYPQSCSKVGRAYQMQQEQVRMEHLPSIAAAPRCEHKVLSWQKGMLPHAAAMVACS